MPTAPQKFKKFVKKSVKIPVELSDLDYQVSMFGKDALLIVLADTDNIRKNLKEVKKEIKDMEKITTDDYVQLKNTRKDLRLQMKDMEEAHESELRKDTAYMALIDLKMKHDSELALKNQVVAGIIKKLPPKQLQLKFKDEDGADVRVDIRPAMELYVDGKMQRL